MTTDLDAIVAELERLDAAATLYPRDLTALMRTYLPALLAERRRMKAALEFYADEPHWDDDGICWIPPEWSEADFPLIAGSQDRGAFAAAVLKGSKP